jgi:hypothetical protein
MSREITTVVTGQSYLECPRWHDGRIWFSDFYLHRVYSAAEDGGDLRIEAEVPQQPSGLGWLPDGRLLVVSMRDKRILRREPDGSLVTHADLADIVVGVPNDMVVDDQGRAYVGEFGFDLMGGAPLATADLLRVDPDGTVTTAAKDMWFANGSVITDAGVLLVDETFGNRVSAFDIEAGGGLANRRTWAQFGQVPTETEQAAALGQIVIAPDGCSSRRSRPTAACSLACWAAPTAGRCTPARRPTSWSTPGATPARQACSPSGSTSPARAGPDASERPAGSAPGHLPVPAAEQSLPPRVAAEVAVPGRRPTARDQGRRRGEGGG